MENLFIDYVDMKYLFVCKIYRNERLQAVKLVKQLLMHGKRYVELNI